MQSTEQNRFFNSLIVYVYVYLSSFMIEKINIDFIIKCVT